VRSWRWRGARVRSRYVSLAGHADTIYLLASITKPITATALMQQVERGKVLLDDPVVKHIPEFGARGKSRVTVRQLLTHTSGLDEAWVRERRQQAPEKYDTWEARVALICEAPLAFVPGTEYAYCNPPFTVLAEIVRRHTGLYLEAYLREHVFGPLGMRDTTFDPRPEQEERVAAVAASTWPAPPPEEGPYGMRLDALIHSFRRVPEPAGGLWSTAADLIAFGRAYLYGLAGRRYNGTCIMIRPQIDGLQQRVNGVLQPAPRRGLGFALPGRAGGMGNDFLSPLAFGHGGATGTQLIIDPAQDLILVFLTNRWGWEGRSRTLAINAALAALSLP
jgi:CubicO group peptidase (beta-lactamase class C family)